MKDIILITVVVVVVALLSGCDLGHTPPESFPKGAVVLKDLGSGWSEICYGGQRFLFGRQMSGYSGYMALANLKGDCESK